MGLFFMSTPWTKADALKVREDDLTTTQPIVPYEFGLMSDESVFVWDTMPLRDLHNEIVSVNGWSVIFTLTAYREPQNYVASDGSYDIQKDWSNRHGRAFFTYWYSKTGKDWIHGGRVMAEGVSPTVAEWAGTPILKNTRGDIELYYTCNKLGYSDVSKVKGRIKTSDDGVTLEGFTKVKKLFEPDGKYYQTFKQWEYANFRDPSPFIDPKSGELYMVFEGNVAGDRGSHAITQRDLGDLPPNAPQADYSDIYRVGCIGIAKALDGHVGDKWGLLPPLVTAVGVNDQLERPHFIFQDGKYYLFTISHKSTYIESLQSGRPDGVYGFVSENLTGPYRPMNGSGLVLGNPSSQPLQTYSHLVMKSGFITSFIDNVNSVDGKTFRVGGVEAPTVKIKIKNDQTFLVGVYDQGYIPPTKNIKLR